MNNAEECLKKVAQSHENQSNSRLSQPAKLMYLILGVCFLLIGIVGVFLPLLPTTPFLILTAICFKRGSDSFHHWLLSHRVFGPPILDWEKYRAIHLKYKILASVMMLVSAAVILPRDTISVFGRVIFSVFMLLVSLYLWTRNSRSCAKSSIGR